MSAHEIGKQLVAYCQAGDFTGAIDALYADDIVSVEAMDMSGQGREVSGVGAVRTKTEHWERANEVHSCEVSGPYPHDDRFAVKFDIDVTAKEGPTAGQRMSFSEVGLYTVRDGKIAREEFFYAM